MKKKQTAPLSWMISYILLVVFSVLLCNLSSVAFQKIFKDTIINLRTAMATQITDSIDSSLSYMKQFSVSLSGTMSNYDDLFTTSENEILYLKYNAPINELKKHLTQNSIVDSYYIYISNTNKIITPSAIITPEVAFQIFHSQGNMTYDEWFSLISNTTSMRYYADNVTLFANPPSATLFYVQTSKTAKGKSFNVIVLSRISKNWNGKNNFVKENNFVIFEKNKILYSDNRFTVPENFDLEQSNSGILYDKANKSKYMISIVSSSFSNWTYAFFSPYALYFNKLNTVKTIIYLSGVFCLLVCTAISFYFANKNYRPLEKIISVIDANSSGKTGFEHIANHMKQILNEYEVLSSQNKNLTQNIIIEQLLKGYVPPTKESEIFLTKNGIDFPLKFGIVLTFQIDNYSSLFPDNKYIGEQLPLETVQLLISNVIKDTMTPSYPIYSCAIGNHVSCIILSENQHYSSLSVLANNIRTSLSELVYIETTVSLSCFFEHIYDAKNGYNECIYALDYQKFFGGDAVVLYSEIANNPQIYSFNPADENKIINFINSGNSKDAIAYIDQLFETNLESGLSLESTQLFLYDLATTLLRIAEHIQLNLETKSRIFDQLTNYTSIFEIRENMHSAIVLLIQYTSKNNDYKLSDEIQAIVEENYQSVNFSVAEIGYKIGQGASYVSKLFKAETGEFLSNHIQKYRIKKAKHLLLNTDLSIKEIAINVGYSNSNVFISSFKKYEGITPGQYKIAKTQK